MLSLLRNRNYTLIYFGQLCSAVGDQLYAMALLWLTYRLTGSSTAMALVGAAEYVPYLVFGLLGGVLADRFDRRRLMIVADGVRMLAVGLVPLLYYLDLLQAWHLAAVALVQASASAFFTPARSAMMVNILPEPDFQRGSAAFSATIRTARILGPLLGTLLLKVMSTQSFFLLDAASFLLSVLTTLAIRVPERLNARTVQEPWLSSLLSSARRFWANRTLALSLSGNGLGMAIWTGLYSVGMVLLAERQIGGGESTYAMLATAYGIGNVLSNLMVGHMPIPNRTAWIFGGWLFFAAGFLALGLTSNLYVGLIAIAFASMGAPVTDLAMALKIRSEVAEEDLGKAHALWYTGSYGGSAIGVLVFGPLFERWDLTGGFVLGAAFLALLGLTGVFCVARGEADLRREGRRCSDCPPA
jgi:DHA3 family macrolide efflux protein-like MFS transporter